MNDEISTLENECEKLKIIIGSLLSKIVLIVLGGEENSAIFKFSGKSDKTKEIKCSGKTIKVPVLEIGEIMKILKKSSIKAATNKMIMSRIIGNLNEFRLIEESKEGGISSYNLTEKGYSLLMLFNCLANNPAKEQKDNNLQF